MEENKEILKQPEVTVFYARHEQYPQDTETHITFPMQSLDQARFEVVEILEKDQDSFRAQSLEGLQNARGRYVIFLDEGDEIPESFLEKMLTAAKGHKEAAFVMSSANRLMESKAPQYFLVEELNLIKWHMPGKDFMVDAMETPYLLPLNLHGLCIEKKRLEEAASASSTLEQELQILLNLLGKQHTFYFLGSICLGYGIPRYTDYAYLPQPLDYDWYYVPIREMLVPRLQQERQKAGRIRPLYQVVTLTMLYIRAFANMDNANKHVISPGEVPAYRDFYSDMLEYVELETIISSLYMLTNTALKNKFLMIRLKKRDFSYYPEFSFHTLSLRCDGYGIGSLKTIAVRLNLIDYRDGKLEIDGSINDYFSEDQLTVCAKFDGVNIPVVYNQRFSLSKCFGVTYCRMKTFHVSIPVKKTRKHRTLSFVLCANGMEWQMNLEFPSHTSRFCRDLYYVYWQFGDYLAYLNQQEIHVIVPKFYQVLKKELGLWVQMFRRPGEIRNQLPLKMLNFLLKPYFSRHPVWLFFDKIYKGGDSSEYLYKYALQQKDSIKKYYLLDASSADYTRMKKEGYHPLRRGSLRHRLAFLNADLIIASNSTVFAFNDYTSENNLPIRGIVHSEVACVQHGMSVQKIALAQQRLRDNTRLYFCASRYEIENLSKPVYDYMGYDALKLTGVPRYDGLKDRAQKVLLFSPTWRMNSALAVTKNEGVARDYNPFFKETDYYRVYNGLLNDPELLAAARKYGYRIKYVLHPIISPQAEDFTKNDEVEIIPAIGDMSYETLFCESALMVTDFSGVQFDFAYMRKPVVYLHHKDIPQHYEEGTFHYKTMGFGEICHTNQELIRVLCQYMENDCRMPEEYRRRADDFFAYSDNNNCSRIYPIMLEYEQKKAADRSH